MEVMVASLYKLTRSAEGWSEQDVSAWLTSNGFPHLALTVEENGVDGTVLLNLDHESLKDLGVVKVGPRIKLLRLIAKAKEDGDEAEQKAVKKRGTSGAVKGKDDSFGLANVKEPPADAFRVIQQQDERILALEAHIWELRRITDSIRKCASSNASVLSNNSNNSNNSSLLSPFKGQFRSPNSPPSPSLLAPPERKPSPLPISPSSGGRIRSRSESEPHSSPRLNLEEASSPSCTSSDDPSLHANQKSLSTSPLSPSRQHKQQLSLDATSGQPKPNFGPHLSPQAFIARKPSLTRRARSPMPPRGVPGSEGPMDARPPIPRSLSNAEQFNHKRSASAASDFQSHSQTLSKFSGVRASAADTAQTVLTQQLAHLHDPQAWQKFVLMVRYGEGPHERCLAYDEVPLIVYRSIKVRYEKVGFVIKSAEDAYLSSPLKHQIITAAGTDKGAPRRTPSVDEVATSPSLSPSIRAGNLPPSGSVTFEHALAICGYRAEADDEISLKAGERLTLQAKSNGRYLVTRVPVSSSSPPTSVPQCGWVSAACAIETTQLITATSLRDALSAPVDASVLPPSFSRRVALLDHTPTGSWAGELHLSKGDQVKVYRRRQHWSYTRKELTGERGWCPSWFLGHESLSPLRKPHDGMELRRSNTNIRPRGMSSRRRLSRAIGPMELSEKPKAQLVSPPSPLPPIQSSPQWLLDRKV